jgi:alpha-beta hydrolase superfamily lysophospholipase
MTEPRVETQQASDGYPIHVAVWPAEGPLKGHVVILHGVQSHGGWYHGLGRTLAGAGYEVHFPDRRGSGANRQDRGHTPSARRLIDDIAELLRSIRTRREDLPTALAGISWGGKTAVITAARHPELVDLLALVCPGLQPRVGVSFRERLSIAAAFLSNRRKTFPIPLSDPALFTASPEGQRFIAADPLGLHAGTAGLLAASTFIDRSVKRALGRVTQPVLLMLAGQDRIVDNARTLAQFERLASTEKRLIEYPEAHHTLEFEPDPSRYALDLAAWLDAQADVRRRANPGATAGVVPGAVADAGGLDRP